MDVVRGSDQIIESNKSLPFRFGKLWAAFGGFGGVGGGEDFFCNREPREWLRLSLEALRLDEDGVMVDAARCKEPARVRATVREGTSEFDRMSDCGCKEGKGVLCC